MAIVWSGISAANGFSGCECTVSVKFQIISIYSCFQLTPAGNDCSRYFDFVELVLFLGRSPSVDISLMMVVYLLGNICNGKSPWRNNCRLVVKCGKIMSRKRECEVLRSPENTSESMEPCYLNKGSRHPDRWFLTTSPLHPSLLGQQELSLGYWRCIRMLCFEVVEWTYTVLLTTSQSSSVIPHVDSIQYWARPTIIPKRNMNYQSHSKDEFRIIININS
jgi:hypothetical protein